MPMIRKSAVAGQFYAGTEDTLKYEIGQLLKGTETSSTVDAIGIISPHAGYVYSGSVAAITLASTKPRSRYIIIGPNHTGLGAEFGLSGADYWKTPLGNIRIDKTLADNIKNNYPLIEYDDVSNVAEHSIEVQLPILQSLNNDFEFVPLVVSQADLAVYSDMGKAIARTVAELNMEKDLTIIASSDMTHYESSSSAEKKDRAAIDAILKLDESLLVKRIEEMSITMCGYGPAVIAICAAKELGARTAKLIKYQTSGNVSGDYSSVVGYAGIVIY